MAPKRKAKATRASKAQRASRNAEKPALQPGPVAPPPAPKELLLLNEVTARTRLSDTTLWRLEKVGRFPKRIKIGFKQVAWRAREIDAWISGKAADAVAAQPEAA
jgi:prophage regulatory protein